MLEEEVTSKAIREVIGDPQVLKDLQPCTHYLSTGCTILDLAIANRLPGGFGAGRISQLYGREATAKTLILAEVMGSTQRQKGRAYMEDAEFTFDFERAKLFGVDVETPKLWCYQTPSSIEELFDKHIKEAIAERKGEGGDQPSVIGVDSLSSLPSAAEAKAELADATYGVSRARQFSAAFRKFIWPLNQNNLAVICIDQSRVNVGVTYGDQQVTSGGEALKFYASTRVRLNTEEKVKNSKGVTIGVWVGFHVVKNKIAPPFREGRFRVIFDYGIDDAATSLMWLRDRQGGEEKEEGVRKSRKSAWFEFAGHKEQGLERMIAWIENEGKEQTLRDEVKRVWNDTYSTDPRRDKKRWN